MDNNQYFFSQFGGNENNILDLIGGADAYGDGKPIEPANVSKPNEPGAIASTATDAGDTQNAPDASAAGSELAGKGANPAPADATVPNDGGERAAAVEPAQGAKPKANPAPPAGGTGTPAKPDAAAAQGQDANSAPADGGDAPIASAYDEPTAANPPAASSELAGPAGSELAGQVANPAASADNGRVPAQGANLSSSASTAGQGQPAASAYSGQVANPVPAEPAADAPAGTGSAQKQKSNPCEEQERKIEEKNTLIQKLQSEKDELNRELFTVSQILSTYEKSYSDFVEKKKEMDSVIDELEKIINTPGSRETIKRLENIIQTTASSGPVQTITGAVGNVASTVSSVASSASSAASTVVSTQGRAGGGKKKRKSIRRGRKKQRKKSKKKVGRKLKYSKKFI